MNQEILELGALVLGLVFFGILYYLGKRKNYDFSVLTILGLLFGVIVGVAFKGHYRYLEAIGTIYSNLILALVIPLLLFSIISSITNFKTNLKNIGFKTVFFLLVNTILASTLALIISVFSKIGSGITYQLTNDYQAVEVPSLMDTLVSLFPKNLASSWVNGEVVPIVIFALFIAISYNKIAKDNQELVLPFKKFIDAGNHVLKEVINFVIDFTPYALLALIARAVSKSTISDLVPLVSILGLAYFICLLQIFGVTIILLQGVGKLNPWKFFKGMYPAGLVAFTCQSSIGTIPVTVRQLTKKLGVNEEVASFVASLGANFGMPGCAGIWPVLLAVFAINVLGINYSIEQYVFLIIMAMIVSVGTVGVPGTSTIAATALFASVGLPIEIIILLAPISSLVDMIRTTTNVIGAATVAVLVAKSEDELDLKVYNNESKVKNNLEIV